MKKTISNILTGIFVVVLIVTTFLIISNYTRVEWDDSFSYRFNEMTPPSYHVMVIIDGSDTRYTETLKIGIEESALDYNIAYEYWNFSGERKNQKILDQFDIGVKSNVDGIVIQALEDERFNKILDEANEKNIPVITIETKIPKSERVSFISFNRYQIGSKIAKKLKSRLLSLEIYKGTIIMFDSIDGSINDQAIALNEGLNRNYHVKVAEMKYNGKNILNAEGATKELLDEYSDIIAIICNNSEESLGVIQALKDANKLDYVQVIAFGDDSVILDYVKRKVIYGTIIPDIEAMGYNVIKNLIDYKNGNFVSSYQNIHVEILLKENVEEYIEGKSHEN